MSGRQTMSLLVIAVLSVLHSGCATSKSEMAWVRTDGRRIGSDPNLLQQGQTDIAVCSANLDAGAIDQGGRDCMAKKGYALVRKDQAEQARAGFAAATMAREQAPQVSAPSTTPNQNPSSLVEVPLKKDRGTFVVPVQINGAITLDFTIDSGASDVSVPADVFSTLTRTGTIKSADIIGERTYVLADGSKAQSVTFKATRAWLATFLPPLAVLGLGLCLSWIIRRFSQEKPNTG